MIFLASRQILKSLKQGGFLVIPSPVSVLVFVLVSVLVSVLIFVLVSVLVSVLIFVLISAPAACSFLIFLRWSFLFAVL